MTYSRQQRERERARADLRNDCYKRGKTVLPSSGNETILEEAQRLVYGDRAAAYGNAFEEAHKLAVGWTIILSDVLKDGQRVPPEACALMMAWLKITRQLNSPKRDNMVDLAGYAGVAEKVYNGD